MGRLACAMLLSPPYCSCGGEGHPGVFGGDQNWDKGKTRLIRYAERMVLDYVCYNAPLVGRPPKLGSFLDNIVLLLLRV